MEDTSPAPSTVSEPGTAEPIAIEAATPAPAAPAAETPAAPPPQPRSVKWLLLGLLAGFAPLWLTPAFPLISALKALYHTLYAFTFWDWLVGLLVVYGICWVGAITCRVVSKQQSRRAFANGMLLALGLTVALLLSALGLLILSWA